MTFCVSQKVPEVEPKRVIQCVYRFEEEDDEMDPEIEEAFENFCLESEKERAKRQ